MKFINTFLTIILSTTSLLVAQKVSDNEAALVAKNFYFKQVNAFQSRAYKEIDIENVYTELGKQADILYYVFNIKGGGYVTVAGHKASVPVLFYSLDNKFSRDYVNPAFDHWIGQYKMQLENAYIENPIPEKSTVDLWDKYLNSLPENLITKEEKAIPPLLISEWNQGSYYNEQCPFDPAGPGGHAYAGCVATAMGQVMYFHKWPPQGEGSFSYYHNLYDTLSANFGSTYYDWDGMIPHLHGSNFPVAQLLSHLGISVTMNYGPNGSGMWNHSAAYSLRTYFKYCPETEYVFRDSTTLDWDSIIIANLDQRKPLYYAGWADDTSYTSGHAFVCDGYQTPGYYHFNWGWGGSMDDFFYTDNLTPGGAQFTHVQEIIKDIYPDTLNYTYPENCTGTKTVHGFDGSLNDGSYSNMYQKDLDCGYILEPACGQSFEIIFDRFDLAEGDTLFIYEGNSVAGQLIQTFTKNDVPVLSSEVNYTSFEILTGKMFLKFKTDGNFESDGWDISWETVFCNGDSIITDSIGIIQDGSDSCDYLNNSMCKWYIQPPGAGAIYLDFTKFEVADNAYDLLAVYKDAISVQNLLEKFDYNNLPSTYLVPSGVCVLYFRSDNEETADGWELEYTAYPAGYDQLDKVLDFSVYPNPFTNQINISFYLLDKGNVSISVINSIGELVYHELVNPPPGYYGHNLSGEFEAGIYIVKVENSGSVLSKRIICLEK